MAFKAPEKMHTVSASTMKAIVKETELERTNRGSRSERIAVRISPETLAEMHELADALGMRSASSDRVLLPDVIKAAVATTHCAVNGTE